MYSEDDCEEDRLVWAEVGESRGTTANFELFGNFTSCGLFFLQHSGRSLSSKYVNIIIYEGIKGQII